MTKKEKLNKDVKFYKCGDAIYENKDNKNTDIICISLQELLNLLKSQQKTNPSA